MPPSTPMLEASVRESARPAPARHVRCNLCGADDYRTVFEAGAAQEGRIVRCRGCGLMYVNPLRRVELEDYRARGAGEAAGWEPNSSILERQRNQVADYRDALERAMRHAPGGRVLDVGASTGNVLHELQSAPGMQCLGLEPNAYAARYGREQFGLEIRACTLEEAGLPAHSFDVVLLLHVLEHVTDPLQLLQGIHRVLRPGGLLIVETPRYDTLAFRLLGRRERNVVDGWHLFFFETSTLQAMLDRTGFNLQESQTPSRTVTPSRIMVNLCKVAHLRRLEGVGHWLARRRLNDVLALPLNLRDILRCYAVKPA